jgi:polysaccharide pyruvyl transferase WcaK-like protein
MERADRSEAHHVLARMAHADRAHVLRHDYHPGEIMGLVGRFALAIGMRLHFLIFAAVTGTPLMALPYAPKVQDLVSSLRIADHMAVDVARAGVFLGALDRLWDNRERQRQQIAERLPDLQQLARRTVPKALAIIGQGPGPEAVQAGKAGEDLANSPIVF